MPVYEYRCCGCDHRFDRFFASFRQAESAVIACPSCQGTEVKRLISAPMFRVGGGSEEIFDAEASAPPKRELLGRKELEAKTK